MTKFDYEMMVEAVREGTRPDDDENDDDDKVASMMSIPAFNAVTIDDDPIRVVGIALRKSGVFDFIIIRQDMKDGGAFYPDVDSNGCWPAPADAVWPQMLPTTTT